MGNNTSRIVRTPGTYVRVTSFTIPRSSANIHDCSVSLDSGPVFPSHCSVIQSLIIHERKLAIIYAQFMQATLILKNAIALNIEHAVAYHLSELFPLFV